MRKALTLCVALCFTLFSCSKQDKDNTIRTNPTISNASTTNPSGNQAKYEFYKKKIEEYRKLSTPKGPVALGPIQKAWEYGKVDAGSGFTVFKFASRFTGVAYGAAFGFIGAVAGSAGHYINKHYDFIVANPVNGNPNLVNSYSNIYEQVGYLHNIELAKVIAGSPENMTVTEFVNAYYGQLAAVASEQFGVDLQAVDNEFLKPPLHNYLTSIIGIDPEEADLEKVMLNNGVSSTVVKTAHNLFSDTKNRTEADIMEPSDYYYNMCAYDISLSEFERNQLMCGIMVFKYSFSFWHSNMY